MLTDTGLSLCEQDQEASSCPVGKCSFKWTFSLFCLPTFSKKTNKKKKHNHPTFQGFIDEMIYVHSVCVCVDSQQWPLAAVCTSPSHPSLHLSHNETL